MKKFQMTCTCGQIMSVDAMTREEAVAKMKQNMDAAALDAHWAQYHQGKPLSEKPTLEQSHAIIDRMLQELMVASM